MELMITLLCGVGAYTVIVVSVGVGFIDEIFLHIVAAISYQLSTLLSLEIVLEGRGLHSESSEDEGPEAGRLITSVEGSGLLSERGTCEGIGSASPIALSDLCV